MNVQRSSVNLLSNVYPVKVSDGKIDIDKNSEFVGRIMDRSALKKLVCMRHQGVRYHNDYVRYLLTIPGVQNLQIRRMEGCDECSLAEPGDKPWGFIIVNGHYYEICKCIKQECRLFKECKQNMGANNVSSK